MPIIALAMPPIPAEKYEMWRKTVSGFSDSQEFDAARRRQGVNWQRVYVQETPAGPMEVLVIDADDPEKTFREIGESQDTFDVWFRDFIMNVYGIDLSQPPPGPLPTQLLEWSADRNS